MKTIRLMNVYLHLKKTESGLHSCTFNMTFLVSMCNYASLTLMASLLCLAFILS